MARKSIIEGPEQWPARPRCTNRIDPKVIRPLTETEARNLAAMLYDWGAIVGRWRRPIIG